MRERHVLGIALAALLALGLTATYYFGTADGPPRALSEPQGTASTASETPPEPREPSAPVSDAPPHPARTATADSHLVPEAVRSATSLEVLVIEKESQAPVIGAVVAVAARDGRPLPLREWSGPSDESGVARFARIAPGELELVTAYAGASRTVRVDAGEAATARIECDAARCALRVRVLDENRRPAGSAELRGLLETSCGSFDLPLGECDNAGRLELRLEFAGRLYARARDGGASRAASVPDCTGGAREIELAAASSGAILLAQVLTHDDRPIAGACVRVERMPKELAFTAWNERSDAEGRVVLRALDAGAQLVRVSAPGYAPWAAQVELAAGARREELVRLQPGGVVAGRATFQDGRPASGALVLLGYEPCDFAAVSAIAARDGSFRLVDAPLGEQTLHATAGRALAKTRLSVKPDSTTEWNPVLSLK